jgi:hypothetical protein
MSTPRIHFNWGYHDGVAAAKSGRSFHAIDKNKNIGLAYVAGYKVGFNDYKIGNQTDDSQPAWLQYQQGKTTGYRKNPRRESSIHSSQRRQFTEGVATAKVSARKNEYGEYVVKLWIDGEYQTEADYFTDDLDDAMNTAQSMVRDAAGGYKRNPRRKRYVLPNKAAKQIRREVRKIYGKAATDPRKRRRTLDKALPRHGVTVGQAINVLKKEEAKHYRKNPKEPMNPHERQEADLQDSYTRQMKRLHGADWDKYKLQEYRDKGWHTICTFTNETPESCRRIAMKYHQRHPSKKLRLIR